MPDPISAGASIMATKEISKILNTDAGKGFLKTVSTYAGVEIKEAENKGMAKRNEEWGYEKASIKIDLFERPKLEQEMINKFENYQKRFEWKNFFSTISKVWKHIKPELNNDKEINYDSLKLLFDEAKNVSDDDMQEYIAKILAGEYNDPNSVSRQTIRIVQSMTKNEFELFEKYAGLFWDQEILPSIYFDLGNLEVINKHGFSYNELLHLESLNLINMGDIARLLILQKNQLCRMNIAGKWYKFKAIKENPQLSKLYQLTKSSLELLKFVSPKSNQEYIDWSIGWLKTNGLEYLPSQQG